MVTRRDFSDLTAPFPWFGGKRRVAHIVWERFGDVPNYVEPFFGSGAILLARPHRPRAETVNDKDCFVANFYRCFTALGSDRKHPAWAEIAHYANWPRNEADLHARHTWLISQTDFRERMMTDPHYFDAKIAGWWVWGQCQWIGEGWCAKPEWQGRGVASGKGKGVHAHSKPRTHRKLPEIRRAGNGVHRKRIQILHSGAGITRASLTQQKRINLNRGGIGVHRTRPSFQRGGGGGVHRQMPVVGGDGSGNGRGVHADYIRENLYDYMAALADRLRLTVVCCGDFERILGPAPTTSIGTTAVFLDPTYHPAIGRDLVYNCEDHAGTKRQPHCSIRARRWALANGDNPKLRIALCGYEGEHRMPKRWTCVAWKSNGGYGNQTNSRGRANSFRERIWFSPHCLTPQMEMQLI